MDTQSCLLIRRTNSSLGCEVMNSVSLVKGTENSPDKDMDSGKVNVLGSWMQSLDPLRWGETQSYAGWLRTCPRSHSRGEKRLRFLAPTAEVAQSFPQAPTKIGGLCSSALVPHSEQLLLCLPVLCAKECEPTNVWVWTLVQWPPFPLSLVWFLGDRLTGKRQITPTPLAFLDILETELQENISFLGREPCVL